MDKLRRREDILRAAREVFAKKGYHAAKVDDIAKAAKVGKGTVYLYFPDKRSIIQELLDRVFVLLDGAILKVDTDADIDAQVKHNIRAIVGLFLDEPTLPKLLLSPLNGVDPDFQKRLTAFMHTVHQILETALLYGQRLGIVSDGDAGIYATFTLGAFKETLLQAVDPAGSARRPGGEIWSREQIVEGLYHMLSHGYLRTSAKADHKK